MTSPSHPAFGLVAALVITGTALGFGLKPIDRTLTSEALGAVIKVELFFDSGHSWSFCGIWVSHDGKVVVPLQSISYKTLPRFKDGTGSEWELKQIIAIDRVAELAIVQLRHRPNHWLQLADKDAAIGDTLAFLWRHLDRKGVHQGPVLARRPALDQGEKSPTIFQSLGLNLGPIVDVLGPFGSALIDHDGKLTGVYTKTESSSNIHPPMILSATITQLRSLLQANPESVPIPHPLPPRLNRWDEAFWAYETSTLPGRRNVITPPEAVRHGRPIGLDDQSRDKTLQALRTQYPDSHWVEKQIVIRKGQRLAAKSAELTEEARATGGEVSPEEVADVMAGFDELRLQLEKIAQAGDGDEPLLSALTIRLANIPFASDPRNELAAIRGELDSLPMGPSAVQLHMLCLMELQHGTLAAAAGTGRRLVTLAPDNISFLEQHQRILERQRNYEASDKISEQIYALESVFRSR